MEELNTERPIDFDVPIDEMTAFLCRTGSLDSRGGEGRMIRSERLRNIILSGGEDCAKEVPLSERLAVGGVEVRLFGTADRIIDEVDACTVDVIKTTNLPLGFLHEEDYPAHRAQVECLAFLYAVGHDCKKVRSRLTYASVQTDAFIYFYHDHTLEELRERVFGLLTEYMKWASLRAEISAKTRESASKLKFPFKKYREGQSELILSAFRAMKNGERLAAEAPTGIGKTISTVYPAFRAIGDGAGKRIFYLTAKTPLRLAASETVGLLRRHGLSVKSVILTAKERCCLCREASEDCDSMVCPYSENHYASIKEALWELLNSADSYDETNIRAAAEKYRVCPYELSLDLSLWCGMIICDYNYLFDPRVTLRRFFGSFDNPKASPEENIFLVDEAHNLPDRARDIYSAELHAAPFIAFFRKLKESDFLLYQPLRELCLSFMKLERAAKKSDGPLRADPPEGVGHPELFDELSERVGKFIPAAREWLRYNRGVDENDPRLPSPEKLEELLSDARRFAFSDAHHENGFIRYAVLASEGAESAADTPTEAPQPQEKDLSRLADLLGMSNLGGLSAGNAALNRPGASPVRNAKPISMPDMTEARQTARSGADGARAFDGRKSASALSGLTVRYYCVDPSRLISSRLSLGRASVLFSATLSPLGYFMEQFGAGDGSGWRKLSLSSPFPRENLFVGIMDRVSVRLSDRDRTIDAVTEIINETVRAKKGNYLVYFPSYRMMRETAAAFRRASPGTRVITQKPNMSERDRADFIAAFAPESAVSPADAAEPRRSDAAFARNGSGSGISVAQAGFNRATDGRISANANGSELPTSQAGFNRASDVRISANASGSGISAAQTSFNRATDGRIGANTSGSPSAQTGFPGTAGGKTRANGESLVGFAVLGGIFSEGIDLVGERLIGSIIVGVGLANPSDEANLLAEYYQRKNEKGFDYAYACPAMGRVAQAAGRVIRTERDKGIVLLIDDRYVTRPYVGLIPKHWKGAALIGDTRSLRKALRDFWSRADAD